MSEAEYLPPKRKTRRIIVFVSLSFFYALIALIVVNGDPENTLHSSALSWAFSASMLVLAGYVLGLESIADRWMKKDNQ